MFIKICGITNIEDAVFAVAKGANALGFVFYQKSPRYLDPRTAKKIINILPDDIAKVGVFVNSPIESVNKIAEQAGLTHVQLHGEENPGYCHAMEKKVIKAFRIRDQKDIKAMGGYPATYFLLDSYVEGKHGGTGRKFDWALALQAKKFGVPIILSGGLSPENVAYAVYTIRPEGVDVSSGVEHKPGKKDEQKVEQFLHNAVSAFHDPMF